MLGANAFKKKGGKEAEKNKTNIGTADAVLLVQPAQWVVRHHLQVNFGSDQISDVINAIFNHCRPKYDKKTIT